MARGNSFRKARPSGRFHEDSSGRLNARGNASEGTALDENVQEIKTWEMATLQSRSAVEQLSDWIAAKAASAPAMVAHLLWFVSWIAINLGWIPGLTPFDPFPFPFLTLTVSLEAIFLALFVLASQNRLARQADRRSHLDLQIDLLAEREMTAVLRLLRDIAAHLDVETTVTAEQLRDLAKKTDLHKLTDRMEEFTNEQKRRREVDEAMASARRKRR
jgi:uncharacterized membrane protein